MRRKLLREVHSSFVIVMVATGIILGTALSFCFRIWIFSSLAWLWAALALILINIFLPRLALFSLSVAAGVIIGCVRTEGDLKEYEYVAQFTGQTVRIAGTIYDDPEIGGGRTIVRLNNLLFGNERQVSGNLFVQFYGTKQLERSFNVEIEGTLLDGFGSFVGSIYEPTLINVSKPDPPELSLSFRGGFAERVRGNIDEPEVALSLSYLLGQRRLLPNSLLEALRIVGLTHIVVASGYHLSILVGFARKVFKKVSRFAALFFGLLMIICFISITGFTSSMVRAALVSALSLSTWFFGRKFHPAKLLILVASITLLINPHYIQDLGWLLSFGSFAGIMLVGPLLLKYFYGDKKPNFIARMIIETLSAQICCLPILLFFFGSFSILGIFANILITPTISIVMLLTLLTGISSFLPAISQVAGWIATKLLSYHIGIASLFSKFDWATFSMEPNNPLILLLYPVLFGILLYIWRRTHLRVFEQTVIE